MKFAWLIHQFLYRHTVTYHPAQTPDAVIRGKDGRPAINVFRQETFEIPIAHRTCTCGEMWE